MLNAWIPAPVAVAWSVLFVVVLVVHAWHAWVLGGRHRLWHASHIVMATGMLLMFLPGPPLLPAGVGVTAYLVAAGLLAVALAVARARGIALGPLWLVSVADLGWMAYMFAMMDARPAWLGVPGAVWFAVQAAGWATGRLGRVLEHHALGMPRRVPVEMVPTRPGAGHRTEDGDDERRPGVVDGGHRDWSVRISLTVMAMGMVYMLLAMQFGMISMPSMPAMGIAAPGM